MLQERENMVSHPLYSSIIENDDYLTPESEDAMNKRATRFWFRPELSFALLADRDSRLAIRFQSSHHHRHLYHTHLRQPPSL